MTNRRWRFFGLIPLGFFLAVSCAHAEEDICKRETDKIVCTVKENDPQAVSLEQVPNLSRVVVRITDKSPFDECTLGEVKWEDIKQQEPIFLFLQILTKYATGLPLSERKPMTDRAVKFVQDPGGKLLSDLLELSKAIEDKLAEADGSKEKLTEVSRKVDLLFLNPPRNSGAFKKEVDPIIKSLEKNSGGTEPSLEAEQVRYNFLHDQMKDLLTKQGAQAASPQMIKDISSALDSCAGNLATLKANYEVITSARAEFRKVLQYLTKLSFAVNQTGKNDPFKQDIPILPSSQRIATSSIACMNTYTKKPSTPQITVTVRFENSPRFSVSVGPLIATIDKRKLGTSPVKTGTDDNGVPTFKNVFAVVDQAGAQVVPFSFLNFRIAGLPRKSDLTKRSKVTLNGSFGVGLNPNSGTNEVEFFIGPSLDIGRLIIHFGDHIGRFQDGFTGGFNLGDTVPSGFPGTLPIHKIYKNGFGIALSFRLSP